MTISSSNFINVKCLADADLNRTYSEFSKVWGDKYVTSNVQIINPATGLYEYIGSTHYYFTTPHGKSHITSPLATANR